MYFLKMTRANGVSTYYATSLSAGRRRLDEWKAAPHKIGGLELLKARGFTVTVNIAVDAVSKEHAITIAKTGFKAEFPIDDCNIIAE